MHYRTYTQKKGTNTMTTGNKLGYISIWSKQDLDSSSKVVGSGKLNLLDKTQFNVTVFRSETGASSISISRKGSDGKWEKFGNLQVETKVKGNMIALAKGLFDGQPVVLFLFDNSEKQETNPNAPDYSGTIYEDINTDSRKGVTKPETKTPNKNWSDF